MTTTHGERTGPIDPTVEEAPESFWRRCLSQLRHYEQERLLGFGGVVVLGFLVGAAMLSVFAWLAEEVVSQETAALDQAALTYLRQLNSPQMTAAAQFLSLLGSEVVLVAAAILLAVFVWQRRWGAALILVLVTGGAQVLNDILKSVFHRTRPVPLITGLIAAQQFSFPSGHAMVSAAFYFYLTYLSWQLVRGWKRIVLVTGLVLLVLLIGLSRMYLGAHYLSDVIAGYLVGFVWTDAVIIGSRLLVLRTRRHAARRTLTT
jgi:undecaprenyl-diphosphatase